MNAHLPPSRTRNWSLVCCRIGKTVVLVAATIGLDAILHPFAVAQPPAPLEALPTTAAEPHRAATPTFSDLANYAAQRSAIEHMVSQGIMSPISPGKFGPEAPVTRGDFATSMLYMFNLPEWAKPTEFPDVARTSAIYPAVSAAAPFMNLQILCFGCALGENFMPRQPISRAESTVVLVRILLARRQIQVLSSQQADDALANVADAKDLSPPARTLFATAIQSGILALRPDKTIQPGLQHTRADMAELLDKIQKKYEIPVVNRLP